MQMGLHPTLGGFSGPLSCIRHLLRTEGAQGLTRGLSGTLTRETIGNSAFFVIYEVQHVKTCQLRLIWTRQPVKTDEHMEFAFALQVRMLQRRCNCTVTLWTHLWAAGIATEAAWAAASGIRPAAGAGPLGNPAGFRWRNRLRRIVRNGNVGTSERFEMLLRPHRSCCSLLCVSGKLLFADSVFPVLVGAADRCCQVAAAGCAGRHTL